MWRVTYAHLVQVETKKNPFIVEENVLATEILTQMNKKKITSACVYRQGNKRKTTGVIHIHNLLKSLK